MANPRFLSATEVFNVNCRQYYPETCVNTNVQSPSSLRRVMRLSHARELAQQPFPDGLQRRSIIQKVPSGQYIEYEDVLTVM